MTPPGNNGGIEERGGGEAAGRMEMTQDWDVWILASSALAAWRGRAAPGAAWIFFCYLPLT